MLFEAHLSICHLTHIAIYSCCPSGGPTVCCFMAQASLRSYRYLLFSLHFKKSDPQTLLWVYWRNQPLMWIYWRNQTLRPWGEYTDNNNNCFLITLIKNVIQDLTQYWPSFPNQFYHVWETVTNPHVADTAVFTCIKIVTMCSHMVSGINSITRTLMTFKSSDHSFHPWPPSHHCREHCNLEAPLTPLPGGCCKLETPDREPR